MNDRAYLARLKTGNIGVAQGKVSDGLCSIDIDLESEVAGFLALNPKLAATLRTKGERGCNTWFRDTDGSCPTKKIKTRDGQNWGEIRANGSQTIIYGKHPSGCHYRFVVQVPPVQIGISEIVWPEHVVHPLKKGQRSQSTNHSTESCVPVRCASVPLCDISDGEEVLANIEAANHRRELLKQRFPQLTELYEKFIEPKFKAAAQHRNGFIVEAAPFIYRVVAARVGLQLLQFFYAMHRPLFKDSRTQHRYESEKMLESVAKTYRDSLNEIEQKIYMALPEVERDAFRILRDLALGPQPKCEPLQFFMSCKQLGDRLQIDRQSASRLLRRFEQDYRLIKCVLKGSRWTPGQEPLASTYRWLLVAQ
jgi:hypothetical protein